MPQRVQVHVPRLSYAKCKLLYFIHDGNAYNVESATVDVWCAAIKAVTHGKCFSSGIAQEFDAALKADSLPSRWWILCYAAKDLPLYGSKGKAEQALQSEARGDGVTASH